MNRHASPTGTRPALALPLLLGALLLLGTLIPQQANAAPVWWSLTSGTRPAQITPNLAVNEVRLLTVQASSGTYTLKEPVSVNAEQAKSSPEPEKEGVNVTKLPFNAKPSEIRTHLEALYGSENVRVTELGAKEFRITFKEGKGDQPVELQVSGEATLSTEVRGRSDGEIYLTAENLGTQTVDGSAVPIHLADVLPPGFKAVSIAATKPSIKGEVLRRVPIPCDLESLTCTLKEALAPYDQIEMRIAVVADEETALPGSLNAVSVSGGESFLCQGVSSSGKYDNSGCVGEPKAGNFERSFTGPAPPASLSRAIALSQSPPSFGVEDYALSGEEEGGGQATQAGKHPFQLTTTIALNQTADARPLVNFTNKPSVNPVKLPKDLYFNWPPGLIGNPRSFPQCTDAQFYAGTDSGRANLCPAQSAVGVATVIVNEPSTAEVADLTVPLFNMRPRKGEPARFGFNVISANSPVVIDTAVRTGGDYGVTVQTQNITQTAAFLASEVTVWGVPGDPRHNRQRGWSCLEESRGGTPEGLLPCSATETTEGSSNPAFLSLPTACTGPMASTVLGDSWAAPLPPSAFPTFASASLPALSGCNRLPFDPSLTVSPDKSSAATPSGLSVNLHVPQAETSNPNGLAEAAVKDITVALPEGLAVNPSSADGLAACSEGLAGFTGFSQFVPPNQSATFTETAPAALQQGIDFCSDASKVGTVKIKTPILENPLEGGVYLASQNQNPFGSLIALYVIAEDPTSGVVVKLTGETELTSGGQIITHFKNSPQAPFEDAELHFFEGERAPLATPAHCGQYTTTSSIAPWSGNPAATPSSSFSITSGPGGSPCPGQALPFAPSLQAGTSGLSAGSYAPLSTTITRGDGQQALKSVQVHTPAGLAGILSGVALCSEADANAGSCPASSQIGQSTVAAGFGGSPVVIPGGKVYLTEHYEGAPFGLSITEPAKAGPFDLEHDTASPANQPACDCIVVRAKIEVDPHTAELTVTTDQIPSVIDNIAVQVKKVNVTIDRPGFTFNPTSCNPLQITASVAGYEGASQLLSSPFQAANCQNLKFAPKFSASVSSHVTKANGVSADFKVTYPQSPLGTYANLAKAKVSLPKQLPSRLTTLNKACIAATFDQDPAKCPKESVVGQAKVLTPVLPVPLEGPAYFVSHGNEAFPDLTIVLKGYGVTVDLIGSTNIKNGVTTSTFKATPDVPFSSFELKLPEQKFSALTANANLCASKMSMPTELTSQAGAVLRVSTPVTVTGCRKHSLTKKQKLQKALKACRKAHKGNRARRASCERGARRRG